MDNCIFCKIINGDIPAAKVYEDEHVLAFLDIGQVTEGHTLVIPKVHKENLYELDETVSQEIFKRVPKIANAIKSAYNPVGLNLLNNNGELAGQTVFHFHMHLIPRYGEGDGFGAVWKANNSAYTPEDLKKIAANIADNL